MCRSGQNHKLPFQATRTCSCMWEEGCAPGKDSSHFLHLELAFRTRRAPPASAFLQRSFFAKRKRSLSHPCFFEARQASQRSSPSEFEKREVSQRSSLRSLLFVRHSLLRSKECFAHRLRRVPWISNPSESRHFRKQTLYCFLNQFL